jgi:ATP synthase protein I
VVNRLPGGEQVRANDPAARILTPAQAERRAAMHVVKLQGLIALALAGIIALCWGASAGRSALLGGGVGVAATLFFVIALFRNAQGAATGRVVWGFFLGQGLKVALTVALLIVAFRSQGVVPLALLAGYMATYAGYWFARRGPATRW